MTAHLITTAPPCPDWCRGVCKSCSNRYCSPDCSRWHAQEETTVIGIGFQLEGEYTDDPNCALVSLGRKDSVDEVGEVFVSLDLPESPLSLTPAQARELAAVLNRHADQGDTR